MKKNNITTVSDDPKVYVQNKIRIKSTNQASTFFTTADEENKDKKVVKNISFDNMIRKEKIEQAEDIVKTIDLKKNDDNKENDQVTCELDNIIMDA